MKTNLDGNTKFCAFEQFANSKMESNNAKAIARMGEGEHVIVAATGDKVAPLWRRQSNKNANNEIRASFRSMLIDIFEGEENIPASVRAVLKEHDYGQGKPLTARRISAVCNAVRVCAEQERQNQQIQEDASKAECIGRLLGGESIEQIVGEARGEGWLDFARQLGDIQMFVALNAHAVNADADVTLENPFGGNTVLTLGNDGKVTATVTVGEQTRTVNTGKTPQELAAAANRGLVELDGSFADVQVDDRSTGRMLLSTRILPNLQVNGSLPDSEPCQLRTFAGALLISKAGATQELVDAFDNEQLANFAHTLLANPPANDPNVKAAMEQAIQDRNNLAQNLADGIEGNVGDGPQPGPEVVVEPEPQVIEQPVHDVVAPPEPPPVDPATLPYQNPAAETTTTYQATVVANRFATLLVATRDKNAEAAAAALDTLKNDAKLNLDVLILLATKSVSVGSAADPSGQAKVKSILDRDLVAKLAKGFLDAFSDGADLTALTNGQVDAIKRALDSQEAKPAVAALAEKADHALLIGTLSKGYFVNVAPVQIAADDVGLTARKPADDSVAYPVLEKPAKEVVSFLVNVVGLAENAVKGGTQDKAFKPGTIGARLAADLVKNGEPLPQVLKDANAATALRDALDVNSDAFLRFVFDTKNALAAVSPLLKPEMERLAAKIRALIVETTGCAAFAGKLDLSAIPGKLADKLMAFIRNDVALEKMAKLFSVAEPTFEVGKRKADAELAAASYKKGDEAAKAKDASNALTAVNYLKGDASYAEFSSPQALKNVVLQFAQIATNPGMQKAETAKALLTADNNRALKAILAVLTNPGLLTAAVVPQMRGVVRRFMEAIVRHIAGEIPTRKAMNPAELTQGDVNAIYDLFANPKSAAALDRAMGKVATAFGSFQKEVGAAVQDLVDKVFNLKALKVKGVVTSPYANMDPATIKANLDKLDLDEILDDANVNPNRPGTLAFTMNVLQNYFAKLKPEAMRDMLANALCTEPAKDGEPQVEGDCRLLSGVFQSTGPLLQKMLQGLDKRVLAQEYRDAFGKVLDNMKSSMPHLPDQYVTDKLTEFMKASGGKVYSIKPKETLGAATVGETFLCRVKRKVVEKKFFSETTKNVEEDLVVKVMRPDIEKIVAAEKEIFDEAASKVPGMASAWKSQYATIEKEFDFRNEEKNVRVGELYQVEGTKVDVDLAPDLNTLRMPADVHATKDVIILQKVEGAPLDKKLSETRAELREQFARVFQTDPETGKWKTDEKGRYVLRTDAKESDILWARKHSTQLVEILFRSSKLMKQASGKWMKEAFFKSGIFHNDMHGGNLMVEIVRGKTNVTMIDFGNLDKIDVKDRTHLCNMLIFSAARDAESFCKELFGLVELHAKETGISLSASDRGKVRAIVDSILAKGKAREDAGYRFLAILEELRKLGVTLPESIYGVSRGLSRLQSSLEDLADVTKKAHAIYSALFGTTESFAPDEGIFNKDSMHVGCLGEIFTCVLGNPAGKDAAAKLGEILERFDTGVYDKALTKYIIKLANEKRLAHGADEIEKLCDRLKATKEFRQELRGKWADLTERVAKFSKGDNDAIVKLCREIAEKVLDLIYNSCELAVNNVTEHEDKLRIEETTLQTRTVGKKTETYEYKEWEARIWSLPEVISRVVDSATSGFFDKMFLAKNIGATKAKRVMDQIENGKDYPQGHKATAA